MSPPQVLISAHPFAEHTSVPLELLQSAGLGIRRHGFGRKPTAIELHGLLSGATALIAGTEPLPRELLAACPRLRVISRLGVGLDSIDIEFCQAQGITVLTTPDVATVAVAEYTLGLMLSLCRGIGSSDRALRQGQWQRHFGLGLAGTRLGLLGFGRIGQAISQRARALGMQVLAHDPGLRAEAHPGIEPCGFEELLAKAQILSLHLPLTPATRRLLDAEALSRLPPGSYLINTARGEIIDEAALYRALTTGHLAGAALDVFSQEPYTGPLSTLPNVILTPHQAANSRQARIAMETAAASNVVAFLRGVRAERRRADGS